MERHAQFSITIGTLGIVIALIGLFPGIIGLEAASGMGVLQVLVTLFGFTLLYTAAVFAKLEFFPGMPATLAQNIGFRLTLTGLLIAAAVGSPTRWVRQPPDHQIAPAAPATCRRSPLSAGF